jgi:hypothetical protein
MLFIHTFYTKSYVALCTQKALGGEREIIVIQLSYNFCTTLKKKNYFYFYLFYDQLLDLFSYMWVINI